MWQIPICVNDETTQFPKYLDLSRASRPSQQKSDVSCWWTHTWHYAIWMFTCLLRDFNTTFPQYYLFTPICHELLLVGIRRGVKHFLFAGWNVVSWTRIHKPAWESGVTVWCEHLNTILLRFICPPLYYKPFFELWKFFPNVTTFLAVKASQHWSALLLEGSAIAVWCALQHSPPCHHFTISYPSLITPKEPREADLFLLLYVDNMLLFSKRALTTAP